MSNYFCKELNKELPSVTTILNIISKGEGFNNWLKNQGDNADRLLKEAGDFGSLIHGYAETIGKGFDLDITSLRPREKRCVEAFLGWKDNNIRHFIATEQSVFNMAEGYAGTLDGVVELKDGRIALLDYKTSSSIYPTQYLQVAAYKKAYESTRDFKIDTAYILRFEKNENKNKDMQEKEVNNLDYQYEIFLCALRLFNWNINKGEKVEAKTV